MCVLAAIEMKRDDALLAHQHIQKDTDALRLPVLMAVYIDSVHCVISRVSHSVFIGGTPSHLK